MRYINLRLTYLLMATLLYSECSTDFLVNVSM